MKYRIKEQGKKFTIQVQRFVTTGFWKWKEVTELWNPVDENGFEYRSHHRTDNNIIKSGMIPCKKFDSLDEAVEQIKKWQLKPIYHNPETIK